MGKSKKNRLNVVYSTNPHFEFEEESENESSIPFKEQKLYVSIDKKNRVGKSVTLIEEYKGSNEDAKDLTKKLKQHCGVGGGYKNGDIYVQGNHKEKVSKFLEQLGASVKLKGG